MSSKNPFCYAIAIFGSLSAVTFGQNLPCEPTADGFGCVQVDCSSAVPEVICMAAELHVDILTGAITTLACTCMDFNMCHIEFGNASPFANGFCENGLECSVVSSDTNNDGWDDTFSAECQGAGRCCIDISDGPIPFETCEVITDAACDGLGGRFHGANTDCSAVEACCMPGGYCAELQRSCCTASGGTPGGPGSTCPSSPNDPDSFCEICGGLGGVPCSSPTDFCKLPVGSCCCDFQGVCTHFGSGICLDVFLPVCGCNGLTYGNECEATRAGVSINYWGECNAGGCSSNVDCMSAGQFCKFPTGTCGSSGSGTCTTPSNACTAVYDPVCGCDGETYENECEADAANVSVAHDGTCEQFCVPGAPNFDCPPGEYCIVPDGVCTMANVGGLCEPIPNACTAVFDPVCGCDGVTYDNECEAAVAGVSLLHHDPCSTVARLFLVPKGQAPSGYPEGPSFVDLAPGASVSFDVFVDDVGTVALEYLVVISSATGGSSGHVTYDLGSTFIDQQRPDWLWATAGEPCGFAGCTLEQGPPARFGGIGDAPPVTEPKYLGELSFTASPDASGTFVLSLIDPGMDEGTHVRDISFGLIDLVTDPVVIQVPGGGPIPTTSTWGLIVFALLITATATVLFRKRSVAYAITC